MKLVSLKLSPKRCRGQIVQPVGDCSIVWIMAFGSVVTTEFSLLLLGSYF